ncbi:MAG TPA: hypothetical protein VKT77_02110 [Chthonomonadaceae bacterium]|nr:hypothetical protein [Chthonomonadaceae bacterium]
MNDMMRGADLHSRSCAGEELSVQDRQELEAWYSAMDAEEMEALLNSYPTLPIDVQLRAEYRDRLAELQATIDRTKAIDDSNSALREQIDELRQKLVARGILAA